MHRRQSIARFNRKFRHSDKQAAALWAKTHQERRRSLIPAGKGLAWVLVVAGSVAVRYLSPHIK
jgi:hypothetical protein